MEISCCDISSNANVLLTADDEQYSIYVYMYVRIHMCSWFPHESNEYGMRDQFKRQIKCPRDRGSNREGKDSTGLLLRDL